MLFDLSKQAPRALSKTEPVVVLVGDSISTPTPTVTFSESESLSGFMEKSIRDQTGRSVLFYNRAMGGARFDHFEEDKFTTVDSTGLNYDHWENVATDPATTSWLDEVAALNPDLLILNFGMNDGGNRVFAVANFQAMVDDLNNQLPDTDVIYITNYITNEFSPPPNDGENGISDRLFIQTFIKSYCEVKGYTCVDLGGEVARLFGYNPDNVYLRRRSIGTLTLPSVLNETFQDYIVNLTLDGSDIDTLDFQVGSIGANAQCNVVLTDDAGFIKVEVTHGPAIFFNSVNETTTRAIPVGEVELSFQIVGNELILQIDGVTFFKRTIIRYGGIYSPLIGHSGNPVVDAVYFNGNRLKIDKFSPSAFFCANNQIVDVHGGNRINHPASIGWAQIRELLRSSNFSLDNPVEPDLSRLPPAKVVGNQSIELFELPSGACEVTVLTNNPGTLAKFLVGADGVPVVIAEGSNTDVAAGHLSLVTDVPNGTLYLRTTIESLQFVNRRGVPLGSIRIKIVT